MLLRIVLAAIMVTVTAGMVSVMGILPAAGQVSPSASRSFDSASVDPGGRVVVTIAASGYGAAGGVTETLPAGFSYVNSDLDAAQVSELGNNQVRFTLQGDSSFTYTVTASDTPGPHTFSGTLRDADRNDHTVGGTDRVTVNTPPAQATPSASRSFDSASVDPGGRVVVTIAASGYGAAGGVTETLPAGFSYVNSDLDAAQVSELGNNQVRFTLQGDSSFTYTVTASDTPGPHTFSGTLRDADRNDHTVGGTDRVTVNTPPAQATPSASRSFDSASVDPGGRVVVTIAASGYGAAGGVTETLPAGFSYVNSDLDAAQVSELGNNQVRFTLQGDSSFTYTVTASDTPGPHTFSGTLRDADRNDHTVGGTDRVTVNTPPAQATPSASRSFDSASVDPGGRVVVTIAASGYGAAGGVTETLPAGFSYVNSDLDAAQVSELGNNQVRFTLQGDSSFTYTVTASDTPGPHTFSGTLRDADRNDHTVGGADRVTVQGPNATRSFSSSSVTPGARVTVTIGASNYGQAGGVTETLPAGFSYVNSSLDAVQVSELGNNQVRFTLQGDSSFIYAVTASSRTGSHTFSGTLRDADRNDHTVGGSTRITVRSSSGGGGGTTPPANRTPVFSEGSSASRSVAENSAAGTVVGSPVTATDRDGDRLTYRLSGTDESLFSVDASTGQVSVAQGTALDFEVKNSYAVSLRASDPSGSADNISITIRVSNVDEDGQVTLSPQQPKIGTELSAALTDPDGSVSNTSWTWERSTDNTAWVAIAGARSNTYTPVEADKGQYLRAAVAYTDGHGSNKRAHAATPEPTATATPEPTPTPTAERSFSASTVRPGASFTVTIRADNYGDLGRVVETLPAGFTSTDADGQTVTLRLLQGGPQTRTYTVTAPPTPGTYDFMGELQTEDMSTETVTGSTSIRVRSSGGGGGGGGGTTPPANRAPVFSEGGSASRSVAENSAAGTVVGSPVTATDRDGDRLTYRLSGTDESLFSVDASTGQVSVAQGTALDFEVKNSYAVSLRASDPSGSADNISITIRVSNVDEDGQVTLSPQQPKIRTELSAALTDPDGSVSNTSWTWERSTDNTAWVAIAGARSNTYTPVEADKGQYLRAAVAYTDGHGSNKRAHAATPEPTATATPEPTATPTPEPTATPTPEPTAAATPEPTATPTPEPTAAATPEPTATATPEPTATATPEPTATATPEPTATATPEPTATATPEPTATATPGPTATATPEVVPPVEPEGDGGFPVWAIVLIIIGVLAAGAIGFYVMRIRS